MPAPPPSPPVSENNMITHRRWHIVRLMIVMVLIAVVLLAVVIISNSGRQNNKTSSRSFSVVATKKIGRAGLVNLGVSCYANTMLQTLFRLRPFREAVLHMAYRGPDTTSGRLQEVFARMATSDAPVNPRKLLVGSGFYNPAKPQQECTHEFAFRLLMTLQFPQQSLQLSDLMCVTNAMDLRRPSILALANPDCSSLLECLARGELQICEPSRRALPPAAIMIQVDRVGLSTQKYTGQFSFTRTMDFGPLHLGVQHEVLYDLAFVQVHSGSVSGGHYYLNAVDNSGDCYRFDDSRVRKIDCENSAIASLFEGDESASGLVYVRKDIAAYVLQEPSPLDVPESLRNRFNH